MRVDDVPGRLLARVREPRGVAARAGRHKFRDAYAASLLNLERFVEGRALLLKVVSVARRVLGDNNRLTFRMRWCYAMALYEDPAATLDDLREAKTRLEELAPYARRVLGGAHPLTTGIERSLILSQATLRVCETPPSSA